MRVVVTGLLLLSCAPPAPPPRHFVDEHLDACAALAAPVPSIAAAMDRLAALPAPADVSCFVASLSRPLPIVATTSITSAQPAAGRRSPRLFLLTPGLALSIVPEGDGAPLLEFGEWVTPTTTLKGEVELPLTVPNTPAAPFERVRKQPAGTTCGLCHREEAPHPSIADAHVSLAFKPLPRTEVPLTAVVEEHDACADSSSRCLMLHALFDFGEVRQGAFAAGVATFTQ